MFYFLVFLLLFVGKSTCEDTLLNKITTSVEKLILYYKDNFMFMNLDGIYGLRILEGQLKLLVNNPDESRPPWLTEKLKYLYDVASEVCQKSIKHVKDSDPEYFAKLGPLITEESVVDREYKHVDGGLKWSGDMLKVNGMDEKFSDRCMAELIGTHLDSSPCHPSQDCLSVMFEMGHQEYTLIHQVLYTMLAEQKGCVAVLESYLESQGFHGGISAVQLIYCSNNLFEVVDLLREIPDQQIPDVYQDLFLEQQFVCPHLGFMEFLHENWLVQILKWQKENGCFASESSGERLKQLAQQAPMPGQLVQQVPEQRNQQNMNGDVNVGDVVVQSNNGELLYKAMNKSGGGRPEVPGILGNVDNGAPANQQQQWIMGNNGGGMRKLLEERYLDDGCLSHRTAVGAAALGQYLKYIIEPGDENYQSNVNIHGTNYLLYEVWKDVLHQDDKDLAGYRLKDSQDRNLKNYHIADRDNRPQVDEEDDDDDDEDENPQKNPDEQIQLNDREMVYQNQMNILQPGGDNLAAQPPPNNAPVADVNNNNHGDDGDKNMDTHDYYDEKEDDGRNMDDNLREDLNQGAHKAMRFNNNNNIDVGQIDKGDHDYADYMDHENQALNLHQPIPDKYDHLAPPVGENQNLRKQNGGDFNPRYDYDNNEQVLHHRPNHGDDGNIPPPAINNNEEENNYNKVDRHLPLPPDNNNIDNVNNINKNNNIKDSINNNNIANDNNKNRFESNVYDDDSDEEDLSLNNKKLENTNLKYERPAGQTAESSVSLLKSYIVIMGVAVLLLSLMYRFIRNRRIIIRYR